MMNQIACMGSAVASSSSATIAEPMKIPNIGIHDISATTTPPKAA